MQTVQDGQAWSANLNSFSAFSYLLALFKEKTKLCYRLDFLKLIDIKR